MCLEGRGLTVGGGSDLEEVRQTGQHVGSDGGDVVDTLTVFQKDPDQQQNRPEETERRMLLSFRSVPDELRSYVNSNCVTRTQRRRIFAR